MSDPLLLKMVVAWLFATIITATGVTCYSRHHKQAWQGVIDSSLPPSEVCP
jgi:hypothetical protein